MKKHEILIKSFGPAILQLSLNRPEKRNALSCSLLELYLAELDRLPKKTRVLIISGEGSVFCSGLDLSEIVDLEKGERSTHLMGALFSKLYQLPCVTIAAVQGAAIAGGAGLLAACDLAVVEKETQLGFPETRRGLVPAYVASLLSRQMARRWIKELLLTGELFSAERGYEMGLVNRLVDPKQSVSTALDLAHAIVKGAPQATFLTKKLMEVLSSLPFEEAWMISSRYHLEGRSSEEAQEGAEAFLEKRTPVWKWEQ